MEQTTAVRLLSARPVKTPTLAVAAFRDAIPPEAAPALYVLWVDEHMGLIASTSIALDADPAELIAHARHYGSTACIVGRPQEHDAPAPIATDVDRAAECRRVLDAAYVRLVDYIVCTRHTVVSLALRGQL